MDFKRIFGFILLFGFIGYMGSKLTRDIAHLNDNLMLIGFVITVVLILVLVVRRILFS